MIKKIRRYFAESFRQNIEIKKDMLKIMVETREAIILEYPETEGSFMDEIRLLEISVLYFKIDMLSKFLSSKEQS